MRNIPDKNKGLPEETRGPYRVKLPREAGQTPPMTWEEFRKTPREMTYTDLPLLTTQPLHKWRRDIR